MHIQRVYNPGLLTVSFESMVHTYVYTLELSRGICKLVVRFMIILSKMKSHDESSPQDPISPYRGIVSFASPCGLLLRLRQEGHGLYGV